MSEFKLSFFFVISTIGAILLFYLSLCAFANQEALRLPKASHSSSGFACFVAAVFYGGVAGYCYNEIQKLRDANHG